ncbi:MAG: tetraacyldisaccharide 4'-kinase [Flavobacteriales bacterium]|nr:tetraacyldisaccharide 4'-kinase [Flavobacteriales bacterium]
MAKMPFWRVALLPVSWLYGAILRLRHALYDTGLFKSTRPGIPTIAIGNLALGGTGKTPMMELVLSILDGLGPIATLSRGYGRSGGTFHEVFADDLAQRSGDEPVQVKRKFAEARVFVGVDRAASIEVIMQEVPDVKAVVLDDAVQHRALDAGLNIILTTWQRPWCDDALVPVGRLRDLPSRSSAAQIVVVTKCPDLPAPAEQERWRERLRLREGQDLYFAGIEYTEPMLDMAGDRPTRMPGDKGTDSYLLFTGIADAQPLVDHLKVGHKVEHIAFPDHHAFTRSDLDGLAARYATFAAGPKMLITTEKDIARLGSAAGTPLEGIPLATIGMKTVILNEPQRFAQLIRRHVATHTAHS